MDRAAALERFSRIRARTRALFAVLDDEMYYERPIPLRNPVVFYEGHLPVFAVNTLIKKGLRQRGIDQQLEDIFARGIDPATEAAAVARGNPVWPDRATVAEYAAAADRLIERAIAEADLERDDHPMLRRAQALWTILEHEEMHQETLAYMWHQVPHARKRKPASYVTLPPSLGAADTAARVRIPGGTATLGTDLCAVPFAWDNELPQHSVPVDAFTIDVHNVTNAQFMAFVDDGGYRNPAWWSAEDWAWIGAEQISHPWFWTRENAEWCWRAMFEAVPLPPSWPVYLTLAEAHAYARWSGMRLPTEAEFHRAAYAESGTGKPEREYPWGEAIGARAPANFDFQRWDPQHVGARPAGASAFGVHDLVGNGWEWTSTVFAPFDGFTPLPSYPEYSAEFFDREHFVLKGASPFTARALARRGFRNWFRPRYPYVYATFRCVSHQ